MKVNDQVFVYGTLRQGQGNHTRVGMDNEGKLLGHAVMRGLRMYDIQGYYPAVKLTDDPRDVVQGEVYTVTTDGLIHSLDILEGYPRHYNRKPLTCDINGQTVQAWVYYLNEPKFLSENDFIPSGDWVEYLASRKRRA